MYWRLLEKLLLVCLCIVLHSFVNTLLEIYIIKKDIKGNIVTAILLIAAAYILILLDKKKPLLH